MAKINGGILTVYLLNGRILQCVDFSKASLETPGSSWINNDILGLRSGGNSNVSIFIPIPGEMIHFDEHVFPDGLVQPPTSITSHQYHSFCFPKRCSLKTESRDWPKPLWGWWKISGELSQIDKCHVSHNVKLCTYKRSYHKREINRTISSWNILTIPHCIRICQRVRITPRCQACRQQLCRGPLTVLFGQQMDKNTKRSRIWTILAYVLAICSVH